jgi:hypothetical protein
MILQIIGYGGSCTVPGLRPVAQGERTLLSALHQMREPRSTPFGPALLAGDLRIARTHRQRLFHIRETPAARLHFEIADQSQSDVGYVFVR